jgi:hypothetical protein
MTEIPDRAWHPAIRSLRAAGKVFSEGEKRGTKWALVGGAESGQSIAEVPPASLSSRVRSTSSGAPASNLHPAEAGGLDWTWGPGLEHFLAKFGLKATDGRGRHDPLYVYADDGNPEITRQLQAWGFTYNRTDKRWWTRDPRKF